MPQATSYQPPAASSLASPGRVPISAKNPRSLDIEPEILDGEEGAIGRMQGEEDQNEEEAEEVDDKRDQGIMILSGPPMESIKVEDGNEKNRQQ